MFPFSIYATAKAELLSVSQREVDRVLSLRSASSSLSRVTADFSLHGGLRMRNVIDRIMTYAASQFLKVVELKQTSMESTDIAISRLESIKLEHCYSSGNVVIVTGSKLLNLEIVLPLFDVLEIDAPKLQSFSLKTGFKMGSSYYDTLPEVSKSNLPSLSRANIELMEHKHLFLPDSNSKTASKRQLELELCVILFKVLYNVQVLSLQVETLELLIQACNSVKHQSSPFKRMKSLNLKYCEGSLDIPDEVVRYFLGGFPNEEDKRFTVEKLC